MADARRRPSGPVRLVGGIEAGGTGFVCAIGTGPRDLRAVSRWPTTTPEETLDRAMAFFREHAARLPVAALGVAAFGPLDLDARSPDYGSITTTPKPGWAGTRLTDVLGRGLGLPVALDTDVNAAALAEHRWGAARGFDPVVYLTVGTGIGGGGLVGGRPLHGLVHPEMGHIRVPHDRAEDPFEGDCPYHGDCLEGLASGRALAARWGRSPATLASDHPAWALEARYLALGLAAVICILSPARIVMGGGVMRQPALLPLIRRRVIATLNGYVRSRAILDHIDDYVVLPALGAETGVLGAMALAQAMVGEGAGGL
jgi:fructokinase